MLSVTPRATAALASVLESPMIPDGAALRLQHGTDDDGETTVGIAVVSDPEPADEVVPAPPADLFIAPEVARSLDDHVLDAEVQDEQVEFTIRPRSDDGELST